MKIENKPAPDPGPRVRAKRRDWALSIVGQIQDRLLHYFLMHHKGGIE